MKANDAEYLKSFCSKCKKQYDVGFVDAYFPYESENNKCMDCFKQEYYKIKTELSELRARCEDNIKAFDFISSMCGIPDARDACYKINRYCQKQIAKHKPKDSE